MAKRVSDTEREQILAACAEGLSCNEIARQFGRSNNTISRIARAAGHRFAQVNAERAREINRGYTAERRANIRLSTVQVIEDRLKDFNAPTLVYNFGGKDNDYNEHTLDKPDARTMRDLAQTVATLWRVVRDIDAAEQGESDTSALDTIFTQLDRMADEHDSTQSVQPEAGGGDQSE